MMKEKLTRKDYFEILRGYAENAGDEGAVDFCNHQIELLDKKKETKRGLTQAQKDNLVIMDTIVEVLSRSENPLTVAEIAMDPQLEGHSNQKITSLLTQLRKQEKVEGTKEGKKMMYKVI